MMLAWSCQSAMCLPRGERREYVGGREHRAVAIDGYADAASAQVEEGHRCATHQYEDADAVDDQAQQARYARDVAQRARRDFARRQPREQRSSRMARRSMRRSACPAGDPVRGLQDRHAQKVVGQRQRNHSPPASSRGRALGARIRGYGLRWPARRATARSRRRCTAPCPDRTAVRSARRSRGPARRSDSQRRTSAPHTSAQRRPMRSAITPVGTSTNIALK